VRDGAHYLALVLVEGGICDRGGRYESGRYHAVHSVIRAASDQETILNGRRLGSGSAIDR
jgi:hypothetical protein